MNSTRFRPELEGLRGIAVAVVVAAHAGIAIPGGAIGPDLFFVLSGYLITGILLRSLEAGKGVQLAHFYARRVRRILPAITAAVLGTIAAVALTNDPFLLARTAGDGIASVLGVANLHFAVGAVDYFAPTLPSPLLPLWSIGVEEQFYLLAPLLIALAYRLRGRGGVALLFSAVAISSTVAAVQLSLTDPVWAYYLLPTRAYGLALGGLVAVTEPRLLRLLRGLPIAPLSSLAIIGGIALLHGEAGYPNIAGPAISAAAALLIIGSSEGMTGRTSVTVPLSLLPIRLLGRISYSLYLVHFPFLILPPLLGVVMTPGTTALAVLASVATAALLYLLVESPFRRGRFFGHQPRHTLPRAAVLLSGVILLSSVAINNGDSSGVAAAELVVETPIVVATASPDPSNAPTPQLWAPIEIGGSSSFSYAGPLDDAIVSALRHAPYDADTTLSSGCGLDRRGLTNRICRKGTVGGPRIVLIGDSHAAHWMPALDRIGKAYGYEVIPLTKSNCPFYDYLTFDEREMRNYTECAAWRPLAIAAANRLSPALVIISSVWYPDVTDSAMEKSAAAAGLDRLIQQIAAPVALFGDVTFNGDDIPSCLARHRDEIAPCVIRAPYRSSTWAHDLTRMVAKERDLPWFDFTPALCPRVNACPPIIDGIIVYHDAHHLTATMSRHLANALGVAIAQILPPPPTVPVITHLPPNGP